MGPAFDVTTGVASAAHRRDRAQRAEGGDDVQHGQDSGGQLSTVPDWQRQGTEKTETQATQEVGSNGSVHVGHVPGRSR